MPISSNHYLINCVYSELSDLAIEAAKTDGRLARQPLQDKDKELQAHQFLLSRINQLIENHDVAMEVISLLVWNS